MIRFDNGPPDGDYVRYIDELMAQRAASLVAATMTSGTDATDRLRSADSRGSAVISPAFKTAHERARDAKAGANRPANTYGTSAASSPDDVSRRPSTLPPAAATAIASSLMNRDSERRAAPLVNAVAIAVGAILILIGVLGQTSNVLFIVAGIALVSWGVKRIGAAPARTATASDAFATPPAQRVAPRTRNRN